MMRKLSWGQIEEMSDELGEKIKASGFQADYIIGIAMGGLIPLYLVAKQLDIDTVLTISASSYEKEEQKELKITYLPEADLRGKKILLLDDIADTGNTIKGVSEAVTSKYNISELKTATLVVNKSRCKSFPDFYAFEEPSEWVVFPWEKEDFPEYFLDE